MALIAVFAGAGGALLASGAGAPLPTAVLTGGGAFGGTLLLLLARDDLRQRRVEVDPVRAQDRAEPLVVAVEEPVAVAQGRELLAPDSRLQLAEVAAGQVLLGDEDPPGDLEPVLGAQ